MELLQRPLEQARNPEHRRFVERVLVVDVSDDVAHLEPAFVEELPDVIELPRNVLDFSVRQSLASNVVLRFDMKNLFDAPFDVAQGTVTREFYRTGRAVNLAFQWRP